MNCSLMTERCITCGLCQVLAPTIFDYDDRGIVLFKHLDADTTTWISEENLSSVKLAAKECPTHAIFLEQTQ